MTVVAVELKPDCALFTDPESEEAELQNLLLNMMGGLEYEHLSEDEKALLKKHGWPKPGQKPYEE